MTEQDHGLVIQDLSVKYGEHVVLDAFDLHLAPGMVHGLVGRNGAGKTTLLDALYGLVDRSKGAIRWNGQGLERTHVAYLDAENYFYPMITGREYLDIFRTQNHGFNAERWSQVFDLPIDELIDTYSLGMKKKLALLGVLSLDRPILMLDEPFNHLDIDSSRLLQSILLRLRDLRKTILLTSHILASLTELCDNIFFLAERKISAAFDRSRFDEISPWLDSSAQNEKLSIAEGLLGTDGES